jgi:hypothetical protein
VGKRACISIEVIMVGHFSQTLEHTRGVTTQSSAYVTCMSTDFNNFVTMAIRDA